MLEDIQVAAASLLESLTAGNVAAELIEKAHALSEQINSAVTAFATPDSPTNAPTVIGLGFVKDDSGDVIELALVDGKLTGKPAPEGQEPTREILPNTFKTATVIDSQNGLTVSSRMFADGLQYYVAKSE